MKNETLSKTTTLTLAALFSVLAYIVMMLFKTPLLPSAGYLKYDAKDVLLGLESVVLGPIPAVLSTAVVSLIEFFTNSHSGPVGTLMNFISSSLFILPLGIICRRKKSFDRLCIGVVCSIIIQGFMMMPMNYILTPFYQPMSREAVAKLLLPIILPFNLLKQTINGVAILVVYKPLMGILRKAGVMPK